MNVRERAIADIEGLFPIDSQYEETKKVGERLLAQAKRECEDWRNYEVKRFTFDEYKPDSDWRPFDITHVTLGMGSGQDYIWCMKEKWEANR